MPSVFSTDKIHRITEANINYYAIPFVHPKRKMHEHDFIYILSGEWKIGQEDKVYTLKKDDVLVLGAGMTHYGASPCSAETKTMYFHVEKFKNDGSTTLQNGISVPTHINSAHNKNIKSLFSKVVTAHKSGQERKAGLYFELLLYELSSQENTKEGVAETIKNAIHRNPEKFLSNKNLAELANVSLKTAENKFKKQFGTTIHNYVLNFKINEAALFFDAFPEISIKEVAYNLGFYDEYHFSKQFKKIKGISPNEYKRKLRIVDK